MTWSALSEQVREEFLEAQQFYVERVRTARVQRQAEREQNVRDYERARTARKRTAVMRLRPVRECRKCGVAFVPQRANAVYHSARCTRAAVSLRAYHRKKPAPRVLICANPRCSNRFHPHGMKRCCSGRCTSYVAYLKRKTNRASGA